MKRIFFEIMDILSLSRNRQIDLFEKILSKYSESNRHYHNFRHIKEMWNLIELNIGKSPKYSLLFLSCLYHDIIYDSKSKTNEEDSFLELKADFQKVLLKHELDECKYLIQGTKTHNFLQDSYEHKLFLDSDLAILGSSEMRYSEYSSAIRKEYSWVSDEVYKIERVKVLEKFLTREKIYYTNIMQQNFEEKARENLMSEIKSLTE